MPSYRDYVPPGFEVTREFRTWESSRRCPRCDLGLFVGEKDETRIEACGGCGGAWLSTEQAQRALTTGSRAPDILARRVDSATRHRRVVSRPVHCLECGAVAQPTWMGSVEVDSCAHGTWFDRNELVVAIGVMRGDPPPVSSIEDRFLEEARLRAQHPLAPALNAVRTVLAQVLDALTASRGRR